MKLRWSDLRSIQRQVLGRLKRDGDQNAVAVGVGVKNAHRGSRERKPALIVIVRSKVPPRRLSKKIRMGKRRRVRVEIGRGKLKRRVTFATDVITVPLAVPVAAQVRSSNNDGTTGALVFWRGKQGDRHWGLLTAGHTLANSDPDIFITPTDTAALLGRPAFVSAPGDPFDFGVIEIQEADAARLASGIAMNDPPSLPIRDFAALQEDVSLDRDRGLCLAAGRTVDFDTELAVAGPVDWVSGLPGLECVLRVRALSGSPGGPFRPGTSGATWIAVLQNGPMGMLVAAEAPAFVIGIGQALSPVLAKAKQAMGASEMRLVKVF